MMFFLLVSNFSFNNKRSLFLFTNLIIFYKDNHILSLQSYIPNITFLYNFSITKKGDRNMEKEKLVKALENYFEDCKFRKRLNNKTIKAYKIDLNTIF